MQEKMSSMVASSSPLNSGTRAKGRLSRSAAFIQPVDQKKTAGGRSRIRTYDLSYVKWAVYRAEPCDHGRPFVTPPRGAFNNSEKTQTRNRRQIFREFPNLEVPRLVSNDLSQ